MTATTAPPAARQQPHALILAPFTDACAADLRQAMRVTRESWTQTQRLYDPIELAARVNRESVSALIVEADFVFAETMDRAPALKFVGVCRAAVNHIDIDAATALDIVVVNAPGRNANAVAEHALALMLALARRVPAAHEYARARQWQSPTEPYTRFRGVELCGKTLGVIGCGAVGSRLARICAALGMNILAFDPYAAAAAQNAPIASNAPNAPNAPAAPPAQFAPLNALMATSDFISVHAPATPETEGMLDAPTLRLMKPSAYLVSASDPALIDIDALVSALRGSRIAGAAFDVFDAHPIPPQSPLLAADIESRNLILTPHIGGATAETIQRHSKMITSDLLRFTRGEIPRNIVNPQAWERRRD